MRTRSDTYEELQFSSQIPSRLEFLRESSLFAEAFARTLPLVFGPLIIQQWASNGSWAEAAFNWGCSGYSSGIALGTAFGQYSLRRRMRISQLHTPLLDSNLVRAAQVVAEEAGASFLVFGLVGLALSIMMVGFSRSVPVLVTARVISGLCAGSLVARWDPALIGQRWFEDRRASRRRPEKPLACVQANSATWLTGLTFGPLLGIFFHQRAFSRWKATLFLPSRVKALPEKSRHLWPALAPCIGGACVLVLLALVVVCETGWRWLKCDKHTCRRCRGGADTPSNSPRHGDVVGEITSSNSKDHTSCGGMMLYGIKNFIYWTVCSPCAILSCLKSVIVGGDDGRNQEEGRFSELSSLMETESDAEDIDELRHAREGRFVTANDGSEDDDYFNDDYYINDSGELQELQLNYSSPMKYKSKSHSPSSPTSSNDDILSDYRNDPKWNDFAAAFNGKAKAKFDAMLQWRRSNHIDQIMTMPHTKFFVFKKCYPFFIHGRSKGGELVTYENPGAMNLSQARIDGCTPEHLRGILSCKYEYISLLEKERQNMLENGNVDQQARMMTVVDVGGLSISNLNKDTFAFMLTAGDIMDNYYPERVRRIFIINAPFWFTGAWKGVSALLPKTITDKVRISGIGLATESLLQFVDADELPYEYCGNENNQKQLKLGQHPDELRLCRIVQEANNGLEKCENDGRPNVLQRSQSELPTVGVRLGEGAAADGGVDEGGDGEIPAPDSVRRAISSPELVGMSQPEIMRASSNPPPPPPSTTPSSSSSLTNDSLPMLQRKESWNLLKFFKSNSKKAHLGDENQFVYDRLRGEWVLNQKGTVKETDAKNGKEWEVTVVPDKLEELLEQHAITLAIQAAHLAAEWQRLGSINGEEPVRPGLCAAMNDFGPSDVEETKSKPSSSRLIILLTILHASWCCLHVGLETVVPLWMFSPPTRGGLGFEPVDAALVFGFVGCVLLVLKSFVPSRLSAMAQHAPLRALRVGIGIMVVLTLSVTWVPAAELHKPRNESVLVWFLVTSLLSGLAAAVILGRSATAVMLQAALDSNTVRPHSMKNRVARIVEVLESASPLVNGTLFAWAYGLRTPYPMDATFCFNVMAVVGIGLYTGSLVLHINIVGDFGIAPEGATINSFNPSSSRLLTWMSQLRGCPGGTTVAGGLGCIEEILVVPAADVNALMEDVAQSTTQSAPQLSVITEFSSSTPSSASLSSSSSSLLNEGTSSRSLVRVNTPPGPQQRQRSAVVSKNM